MLSMVSDVEVVAIASNGIQAVQMSKDQKPDIVVLDINMPELNGLEAFRQIKQIHPDTGCIIISAQKESVILQEAMSIGIRDYLFKPFTVDQLEEAVERVGARLKKSRQERAQKQQLRQKNEVYVKQLAIEFAKSRRTKPAHRRPRYRGLRVFSSQSGLRIALAAHPGDGICHPPGMG